MSNPYQKHSATSKEAAEKLTTADTLRNWIFQDIRIHAEYGRTGDELANQFACAPGTISARLIELERAGLIVKNGKTRLTESRRNAAVYVVATGKERDSFPCKPATKRAKAEANLAQLRGDVRKVLDSLKASGYGKEFKPVVLILEQALTDSE